MKKFVAAAAVIALQVMVMIVGTVVQMTAAKVSKVTLWAVKVEEVSRKSVSNKDVPRI